jgi:transposase
VRIRNFGFLANRQRATLLPLCFQLLSRSEHIPASAPSPSTDQPRSLWTCPVCGGAMHVVERLSATQLLLRSPPLHDEYAA